MTGIYPCNICWTTNIIQIFRSPHNKVDLVYCWQLHIVTLSSLCNKLSLLLSLMIGRWIPGDKGQNILEIFIKVIFISKTLKIGDKFGTNYLQRMIFTFFGRKKKTIKAWKQYSLVKNAFIEKLRHPLKHKYINF